MRRLNGACLPCSLTSGRIAAGGSAANTIMGVVDFGGQGAYAGKTGRDEIGEFFLSDMRQRGVHIEVPPTTGQSGTCVVLITEDAQRTMLTNLGVSATLGPDDISEADVRQAKYVYIEGYLFTNEGPRAAALKAIQFAKQNGVKVAFTVSDPFLIGLFRDRFWQLIEEDVDLLFCNEEEARADRQAGLDRVCSDHPPALRERCTHVGQERQSGDAPGGGHPDRRGPDGRDRHNRCRRHVRGRNSLRNHERPELETSRSPRLARGGPDRQPARSTLAAAVHSR